MSDLVVMGGSFVALFCAAMAVAYVLTRLAHLGRNRLPRLAASTPVRISTLSGVYRARLVTANSDGVVITAPMQRDHYVPIRPGERVTVEAPVPNGVVLFRSTVIERHVQPHEVCLAKPRDVHFSDRRNEPREKRWQGAPMSLDGRKAELVDVSTHGARVLCDTCVCVGDLCLLILPEPLGQARGWALECVPAVFGSKQGSIVRLRFAEPLAIPPPRAAATSVRS